MKRVLMIAYHFPPLAGSSGIQRTLRFCRHLRDFGWHPIVLTAHPRAYARCSSDQLSDIPADVEVIRAQAWDASRHFAIAGRYPGILARPDRWLSWWLGAVPSGLAAIRRLAPKALWSTYPVATAHRIGATLAQLSGLPWVADFRDPMAQEGYPEDPATWRSFDRLERRVISRAQHSTFTSPSAASTYRRRYPARADRITLLENGYDEESFADVAAGAPLNPGQLTLLHSGIVYPSERDPSQLFAALARLKTAAPQAYSALRLRFRAPMHDELIQRLAGDHGVSEAIEVCPPLAYRDALAEMLRADGLLILQAQNCDAQIPAKLYEYFRAGRPILLLTASTGDTAAVAKAAGLRALSPLDNAEAIADLLSRFIDSPMDGTLPTREAVARASRHARARHLAALLDSVHQ